MSRQGPDPFISPELLARAFNKSKGDAAGAVSARPPAAERRQREAAAPAIAMRRSGRGVRVAAVVLGAVVVGSAAILVVAPSEPVGRMAVDDDLTVPTVARKTGAVVRPRVAVQVTPKTTGVAPSAPGPAPERPAAVARVDRERVRREMAAAGARAAAWVTTAVRAVGSMDVPRIADPAAAAEARRQRAEALARANAEARAPTVPDVNAAQPVWSVEHAKAENAARAAAEVATAQRRASERARAAVDADRAARTAVAAAGAPVDPAHETALEARQASATERPAAPEGDRRRADNGRPNDGAAGPAAYGYPRSTSANPYIRPIEPYVPYRRGAEAAADGNGNGGPQPARR